MRNHVYVRPAKPEDRELFALWTAENLERNDADPAVIGYPTTFVLCAYDADGPLAFLPVQQPLFLEGLAPRPGASPERIASALRDLMKACVFQASLKGSGEVYFLSQDESTDKFAQHHAFTKLPFSIYRAKLSDLEG